MGKSKDRTLVIGAGSTGKHITLKLLEKENPSKIPIAFLDDDPEKQSMTLLDLPIYGPLNHLEEIITLQNISSIIIAIPSLLPEKREAILNVAQDKQIDCQEAPNVEELLLQKKKVFDLHAISFETLLKREPVSLDTQLLTEKVKNKTILITGAGGSIGSEICRQLIQYQPEKLLLLGHGENSIYEIHQELQGIDTEPSLIQIIADIRDRQKITEIIRNYRPDIIYHTAAHKHVPLMEHNPHEAVMNNILGTQCVGEIASQFGVESFVMVSSDKAVNPTNVMGATKRLCEMVVQRLSSTSQTKFSSVRFGNVLGSRGSVIPLFRKQILAGGPVTVTDPRMTRYFMTIKEAASLVLQASSLANGGEIFVLDMGKAVKIADLARNLIELSGYSLSDISIEYTGIRDGEKLYEELLLDSEVQKKQIYPKIYVGKTDYQDFEDLDDVIENFNTWSPEVLRSRLLSIANHIDLPSVSKGVIS